MAPYRRKNKKRVVKNKKPNWLDLPDVITEIIFNKLHFPDQIRALAVCKSWLACKAHVKRSYILPWVINMDDLQVHSEGESDNENEVESFVCEFVDPYSQNSYKVSNSIEFDYGYVDEGETSMRRGFVPLVSKNGWNWVLFIRDDESSVYFLHNPFTNDISCVHHPYPEIHDFVHATIKGDPTSPECTIFTVNISDHKLAIDIMKRNGSSSSYIIVDEEMGVDDLLYSVLYMNGNIHCLFPNGCLYKHDLEVGTWELLTSGFPAAYKSSRNMRDCWLIEINGSLIMVRMDVGVNKINWFVFRFNWSSMSWVVETDLRSCAIYISGSVAFSAPLKNRNGEILEGCRLFHLDGDAFTCYSISERIGNVVQCEEYKWINGSNRHELSFMEPPSLGI